MKTLPELINEGTQAVHDKDAAICGSVGHEILELLKGELQVEHWPDITDADLVKLDQNARKLLVGGLLFILSNNSGPAGPPVAAFAA